MTLIFEPCKDFLGDLRRHSGGCGADGMATALSVSLRSEASGDAIVLPELLELYLWHLFPKDSGSCVYKIQGMSTYVNVCQMNSKLSPDSYLTLPKPHDTSCDLSL